MTRWWVALTVALGCQASPERPNVVKPVVAAQAHPAPAGPVAPPTPPVPTEPTAAGTSPTAAPAPGPPPLVPDLDYSKDIVTANRPTARQVAAMIVRGRYNPRRVDVKPRGRDRDLDVWAWSYRGIPVLVDVTSSRAADGWHTRFYREVAEPEPVDRAALLAPAEARAKAAFRERRTGASKAALVYLPVTGERTSTPTDRADVAHRGLVIERYFLAYRVTQGPETVFVDAYSGVHRGRIKDIFD